MPIRRFVLAAAIACAAVTLDPLGAHAATVDAPPADAGTMTIQVIVPAHAGTSPGGGGTETSPVRDPLARTGPDGDLLWPLAAIAVGAIAIGGAARYRAARHPHG
jgi:hypothetical protein